MVFRVRLLLLLLLLVVVVVVVVVVAVLVLQGLFLLRYPLLEGQRVPSVPEMQMERLY